MILDPYVNFWDLLATSLLQTLHAMTALPGRVNRRRTVDDCDERDCRPCACFAVCKHQDALHFAQSVPTIVHETDAWATYLRVVYGTGVKFPFSMANFTFFYHNNHGFWPRRVAYPMNTCSSTDEAKFEMQPSLSSGKNGFLCKMCWQRRWMTRRPNQSLFHAHYPSKHMRLAMQRQRTRNAYRVVIFPGGNGESLGFSMSTGRFATHNQVARARSSGFVEVMRTFFPTREGQHDYGCWYAGGAIGSGIFLNTGRDASKRLFDCDKTGARLLEQQPSYVQKRIREDQMVQQKIQRLVRPVAYKWFESRNEGNLSRSNEIVTVLASHLGYETIQCPNSWGWGLLAEIVDVRSYCMSQQSPVLACPPTDTPLFTGLAQQHRCRCVEPHWNITSGTPLPRARLPALNCGWPA